MPAQQAGAGQHGKGLNTAPEPERCPLAGAFRARTGVSIFSSPDIGANRTIGVRCGGSPPGSCCGLLEWLPGSLAGRALRLIEEELDLAQVPDAHGVMEAEVAAALGQQRGQRGVFDHACSRYGAAGTKGSS